VATDSRWPRNKTSRWSRHSVRMVLTNRSANAFARDDRTGVFMACVARVEDELIALANGVREGRLTGPAKIGAATNRVLRDSGVARCFRRRSRRASSPGTTTRKRSPRRGPPRWSLRAVDLACCQAGIDDRDRARALAELNRIRRVTLEVHGNAVTVITKPNALQVQLLKAFGVDTSSWDRAKIA